MRIFLGKRLDFPLLVERSPFLLVDFPTVSLTVQPDFLLQEEEKIGRTNRRELHNNSSLNFFMKNCFEKTVLKRLQFTKIILLHLAFKRSKPLYLLGL